ncbi:MAG: RluA family pseudouridine synthase [Ruminococcaceae bacterium]|nr:RluA family pseudouridine synthase [Oscillospiraceae bacterium]
MEKLITCSENGIRLDMFLAKNAEMTRSHAAQMCENEKITVNGKPAKKNLILNSGDAVYLQIDAPVAIDTVAEDLPLNIVYEDNDLLVVDKPQGMVVHPAAGNYSGTLVNALLHHCKDSLSGINGKIRPGIVHRIDKNTAGLLIIAKNDASHEGLAEQIKVHSFVRRYHAILYGRLKSDSGTVDMPIGRHPSDRKKMAVYDKEKQGVRNAVTHYRVLERFDNYTYTELTLETGRTHQIRVHTNYLGHPVVGDDVYASSFVKKDKNKFNGQLLYAKEIGFVHPITKQELFFSGKLPDYFTKFLEKLRGMPSGKIQ